MVAVIFLSLTFVTGLLRMNVGGLPGVDEPKAFLEVVLGTLVAAVVLIGLFRWRKWL